jgi:DNA (cytosine-5)-methyltransferase 1
MEKLTMYNGLSLFSGGGGLDAGVRNAGLSVNLAVEIDHDSCETLKLNFPECAVKEMSVADATADAITPFFKGSGLDFIIGGPPCQSFSVFGNRLGIEDARGQLVFEYLRLVDQLQPKVFLLENVRGMLSMSLVPVGKDHQGNPEFCEKGSLLKEMVRQYNAIGYHVDVFVVNSVNYGAAQIRERVLLIGNRLQLGAKFPEPKYSNRPADNLPPFTTLGDVIGPSSGFVDPDPSVMNFSPRKLKYLSMVPEGGNWRSLPLEIQKESMGKSWYLKGGRSAYWRKLSFDFPSPTVVTMPNHAGTSMCHPTELRAISVGEAACIQGFPQNWQFAGKTNSKFKQVGNAVPVILGQVAGEVLKSLLDSDNKWYDSLSVFGYTETHLRPHVRTRSFWKNGKALAGSHSYYDDEPDPQMGLFNR